MAVKSKKIELFVGIFVLILGIGLLAGAFVFKDRNEYKLKNWVHTQAVVVDYYADRDDDDYVYYEIVRYTVDGINYRKRGNVGSSIRPSMGSTREIAYNPDNPEECIFVNSVGTGFIVMLIVGAAFTVASVLLFVQFARKKR